MTDDPDYATRTPTPNHWDFENESARPDPAAGNRATDKSRQPDPAPGKTPTNQTQRPDYHDPATAVNEEIPAWTFDNDNDNDNASDVIVYEAPGQTSASEDTKSWDQRVAETTKEQQAKRDAKGKGKENETDGQGHGF